MVEDDIINDQYENSFTVRQNLENNILYKTGVEN